MQLPSVARSNIDSLGRQDPSIVDTTDKSAVFNNLSKVASEFFETKDRNNSRNIGIQITNELSDVDNLYKSKDTFTKDELSEIGIDTFAGDSRVSIPKYEAMPFIKKGIADKFAIESKGSFSLKKNYNNFKRDTDDTSSRQFYNDLSRSIKTAKIENIKEIKRDIKEAQDGDNYDLGSSLISLLPKAEQSSFNSVNSSLRETSGVNNVILNGSTDDLTKSYEYLKSDDYSGSLSIDDRRILSQRIENQISRMNKSVGDINKDYNAGVADDLKNMRAGINNGDISSSNAYKFFAGEVDPTLLNKKNTKDMAELKEFILISESARKEPMSNRMKLQDELCSKGNSNCDNLTALNKRDFKRMASDPMEYAISSSEGFDRLDSNEILSQSYIDELTKRYSSKGDINKLTSGNFQMMTNEEKSDFNSFFNKSTIDEKLSILSVTLSNFGVNGMKMFEKESSNYFVAKIYSSGKRGLARKLLIGRKQRLSNSKYDDSDLSIDIKKRVNYEANQRFFENTAISKSASNAIFDLINFRYIDEGYDIDLENAPQEAAEMLFGELFTVGGHTIAQPSDDISEIDLRYYVKFLDETKIPKSNTFTGKEIVSNLRDTLFSKSVFKLLNNEDGGFYIWDTSPGSNKIILNENGEPYILPYDEGFIKR